MISVGIPDPERPPGGVFVQCPWCALCGAEAVKTVCVVVGRGEALAAAGVCERHVPTDEGQAAEALRALGAIAAAAAERGA